MPFDAKQADRAVGIFENILTLTRDRWAGKPFILPKWQKKIVQEVFGTIGRDGFRQYTTVWLEVGKKNGKSELGAGLALCILILDERPGCEVYSCASTRDQASLVFKRAARMVQNDAGLRKEFRVIPSQKMLYRRSDPTSFYKATSADQDSNDGVMPSACIFDEVHRQRDSELWDIMKYGMANREDPLMVGLTTAGIETESPLALTMHDYAKSILRGTKKDPSFYPVIFEMAEGADWRDPSAWKDANPALGDFKLLKRMKEDLAHALASPLKEADFRRLHCNEWLSASSPYIPAHIWKACDGKVDRHELVGRTCFAGLDLSNRHDLTALVLAFPPENDEEPYKLLPFYWIPEATLLERVRKEGKAYQVWKRAGLLETTPGDIIDFAHIRERIAELGNDFHFELLTYDRAFATQLALELEDLGFSTKPMAQGNTNYNEPIEELDRLAYEKQLAHGGHQILADNMNSTTLHVNAMGYRRPIKPDVRTTHKRIDGVVATLMALRGIIDDPNFRSVYEQPGQLWVG